jgi:DNA-binding response OmpR family regulator
MVLNILIVDDDADLLNGQAIFLRAQGYRVETAKSMKEGLARLTGFKPDLILADLMMEEYGSGDRNIGKWFLADEVLTKPVPLYYLLERVEHYLQRRSDE